MTTPCCANAAADDPGIGALSSGALNWDGAPGDTMPSSSRNHAILFFMLAGIAGSVLAATETSEPPWGLPQSMLDGLAREAEAYVTRSYRFSCVETERSVRYRPERSVFKERKFEYAPGGFYRGSAIPEFRLQIRSDGRVGKPVRARTRPFPTADDWTQLFSAVNRPLIIFRDWGIRLDGFDLVREIEFRGWLPFKDGRDVREWEGVALVEAVGLRLVAIRAHPRNQEARLPALYDRWARSWKISLGIFAGPLFLPIKTFRTARRPLAFHCWVRFDHRLAEIRLPTLLRYETHRAVSRTRTEPRVVSTWLYGNYRAQAKPI